MLPVLVTVSVFAVLVVPVAGWMQRVTMPGPTVTEHGAYRFVPLV